MKLLLLIVGIGLLAPAAAHADSLVRQRSLGQGYFDNNDFERAADEYRAAFSASGDPGDRFNVGLSLLMLGQFSQARAELAAAAEALPDDPAPRYALAILARRTKQTDEALTRLDEVLARDPADPAALFNKGLLLQDAKKDEAGARACYEGVLKLGWTAGGLHFVSALYRHARLVLFQARAKPGGDPDLLDQSKSELRAYQRYQAIIGVAPDEPALEEGQYLWPKVVRPERPPADTPEKEARLAFEDATAKLGLKARPGPAGEPGPGPGGPGVLACDLDLDGLPELFEYGNGPLRLWRSVKGRFADGTVAAGLAIAKDDRVRRVACGDWDNDGDMDLYLANDGPDRLLKLDGARFVDVTAKAEVAADGPAADALWIDVDHDGDLDLFVVHHLDAGGRPVANLLFLNRGLAGTFERLEGVAGLTAGASPGRAVVAFDHDGDRDIDVLVANEAPWTMLFSSLREGRFEEVSRRLGLADDTLRATGAHAADLDNDGRMDLLLETAAGVRALANRKERFEPMALAEGPPRVLPADLRLTGRFDLVRYGPDGAEVWLAGDGGWSRGPTLPATGAPVAEVVEADVDRDGAPDLVAATARGLAVWRNTGAPGCGWVRLRLSGSRNNRHGVGALLELSAGPLYAMRQADGRDLTIGFDGHGPPDTVRLTWPNGILQQEIRPAACQTVIVKEAGGLPSSCPFLFAFDGQQMRFVMDVLGAAPLGIPAERGRYLGQDPTEYGLVSGELLRPDDRGRLRLSVTEELREETLYLDEAALVVLDHPEGTRVVPNERYGPPEASEYRVFAWPEAAARPPVSVRDTFGNDVLDLTREVDGRMVGAFVGNPGNYRGTVDEHAYVLDPGDLAGAKTVWLIATGWIYWGGGSASIATSQDEHVRFSPLRLDVRDGEGGWVTARQDVGFPAGKTRAMPVDLTGVFRDAGDFRVRLVTTLRLHWDAFSFVVDPPQVEVRETRLAAAAAELRWHGFSRRVDDDPTLPERFVYDEREAHPPWDQMQGMLTRYGDVRELVRARDDRLAVFSAGDELALEFASPPAPKPGWRRDFLVYLDGWNKDGDYNNGLAQQVEPLPFHGMSGYPYGADERQPDGPVAARYRAEWNTRPGRRIVAQLRRD